MDKKQTNKYMREYMRNYLKNNPDKAKARCEYAKKWYLERHPKVIRYCQICGKQLEGRRRKWCSKLCSQRTPENKSYHKKYQKKYCKKPEVKEKRKAWTKNWFKQHPEAIIKRRTKNRERARRPEVKIAVREYGKEYRKRDYVKDRRKKKFLEFYKSRLKKLENKAIRVKKAIKRNKI